MHAWPPKRKAVYTLVLFYIFIHLPVGSDHNLQAVRSIASGGKFYWSPPDKENTAKGAQRHDKALRMSAWEALMELV